MVKDKLNKDELEELGLIECCAHCGSLHITEEGDDLYCNDCGILNYTKVVSEEEYNEKYQK